MPDSFHGLPLPKTDGPLQAFWEHARAGRLAVQQCGSCGHLHFPPSPVCPECLSEAQEWVPVSGRGTLYSWCEFHRGYWDSVKPHLPYNVAMVKLDEGPVLLTNLVGAEGADLALGLPVRVTFTPLAGDVVLPQFTLA
jgi:uncharacterized protein